LTDKQKQNSDEEVKDVPKIEEIHFDLENATNAQLAFTSLDSYVQFRLHTTLDYIDKLSKEVNNGTAIYEKLILLDGATIALSITLLTALSSRWSTVHGGQRPHLWMVDVAWCLLILSIFCSYQVIVRRHSGTLTLFLNFSSDFKRYSYQRVGVMVSYLKRILKGNVLLGEKKVDISKVFDLVPSLLNKEMEDSLKEATDMITELKYNASKENIFAKLAVYSTILAIFLLCIFTIQSVSLLF
jgi:hypothetical protein